MRCRYCGGEVKATTVATASDTLAVLVECGKCGKYIDTSALPVCNRCGSVLKNGICKKCGIRYFAKGGIKTEEVKIATEDDVTKALADLMAAVVMKNDDAIKEKIKQLVKTASTVYDD